MENYCLTGCFGAILSPVVKVLVTGIAGFIGFHLARRMVEFGHCVFGIDNLNRYYDVRLKLDRLQELGGLMHGRPKSGNDHGGLGASIPAPRRDRRRGGCHPLCERAL